MEQENHQPRSRQEIYDAIAKSSKLDFIIEEMKRFGFWDISEPIPKVSDELHKQRNVLQQELNDLLKVQHQYNNTEKILKEMRAERMAAALLKRTTNKEQKAAQRSEKAKNWATVQSQNISYLGDGVSAGLNNQVSEVNKLQQLGLPVFENALDLATAIGIDLSELRFLAYNRTTSRVSHYQRFEIPKKTGGKRLISAPMPRLKKVQHWILEKLLYQLQPHQAAHGFIPQLSIVSNAQNHLGKELLINIDLKNFFPTIGFKRIKGLFVALGYSEQLAIIFALLCSEPNANKIELDNKLFYVATGERLLPQGAPTSPAITNLICHKLDLRLNGLAQKFDYTYSRYADDISFSAHHSKNINLVLLQISQIIKEEGFIVNPNKVHISRKGGQKEVTGIIVNEKLNVSKEQLKTFRAVLHTLENKGADKVVFGGANLELSIKGFANFVNMVIPEKGQKLLEQVNNLLSKPEIKTQLANLQAQKQVKPNRKNQFLAEKAAKENQTNTENTKNKPTDNSNDTTETQQWWDIFG